MHQYVSTLIVQLATTAIKRHQMLMLLLRRHRTGAAAPAVVVYGSQGRSGWHWDAALVALGSLLLVAALLGAGLACYRWHVARVSPTYKGEVPRF